MAIISALAIEEWRQEAVLALGRALSRAGKDWAGCLPLGAASELETSPCLPCLPAEGSGGQPPGRAGSALGRWWRGVRGGAAAGCPHHQREKGVPCPLEGLWVVGGLLGARRELGKCPRVAPGILEVPWEQGKRMRMLLQRPVGCFVGNFFLWGAATGGLPKTLPFLA